MLILTFLKSAYASVMDETRNPLRRLSSTTAHMMMQVLAWMWSVIFSLAIGSFVVFGITAIAHALIVAGLFVTFTVFWTAERKAETS